MRTFKLFSRLMSVFGLMMTYALNGYAAGDPVISPDPMSTTISAAIANNTVIMDVNATDPNGDNLSYSITSGNNGAFAINSSTGVITILDNTKLTSSTFTLGVKASDDSPSVKEDSGTVTVTVTSAADGALTLAGDASGHQDDNLTYTVTVLNQGPSQLTSATVTSTFSGGTISYAGKGGTNGANWSCASTATTVTCSTATALAQNASSSFTFTIKPSAVGTLSNNSVLTSSPTDPVSANNSAEKNTTIAPSANLAITVIDSKDPVTIGELFSYTIDVTNSGPSAATNVVIVDNFPSGMTYNGTTGAGWTCSYAGGVLVCTLPTLASGANSSVVVNMAAPAVDGNITNSVYTVSDTYDQNTANNTATQLTQVISNATDMSVAITDSPDPVITTSALTYTVTAKNNSTVNASGIQVIDNLLSNVNFISVSGTGWTCSQGQIVVCDYAGILAPGVTTAPITISVTAPSTAGDLNNSVTVSSTNPDSNSSNNTATATTTVITGTSSTTGGRDFYKYLQYNVYGDMKTIGNTLMWANPAEAKTAGCTITGITPNCRNNEYTMRFVDVDGDASTYNSSSADLDLGSAGYEIVWAGLYWQGHLTQNAGSDNTKMGDYATAVANAKTVKLKTPSGSYVTITANNYDKIDDTTSGANMHYSGFADITAYVTEQGTYTVANIQSTEGKMAYLGGYGGWAMQVIYKDPTLGLQFKNVSIFNGFKNIPSGGSAVIPISGFVTPLTGAISSSVSTFITDGDNMPSNNLNDHFLMYNKKTTNYVEITDATSPLNNVFNSTIANIGSHFTSKNPNYQDNLGIDIDRYDVSNYIDNNQTSTQFRFTTSGDVYDVDFLAFATDMYTPLINDLNKTATKNGVSVGPSTTLQTGDTLIYSLKFKNTGGETASEVEIFDDFDLDGLSSVFDLSNFDASAIKLSVKNGTSWQASPTCGYDNTEHKVWCRIAEMKFNDEYTMQFATTIRSDYSSVSDKNVINVAYSKYKNGTTNEYVVITSNGYGGESNAHNAGTIYGIGSLITPNPDECGMFPSVLTAENDITSSKPIECSLADPGTSGSEVNVINTTSISAGGTVADMAASCALVPPPTPLVLPSFLHSTNLSSTQTLYANTAITGENVNNINIGSNNITVTFTATATPYSDSAIKVMKMGALVDNNKQGITYVFNEGDYWIESWDMNGNTAVIQINGNVRFFVSSDFTAESNTFSINTPTSGIASNFHLYSYNDILFTNNGFANSHIAGFLYAARDIVADGNSNFQTFTGAIRAGRNINLQQNQTFTYDGSGANGNAEDCTVPSYIPVGLYDAWDTSGSIYDRNISTKIVNNGFNLTLGSLNSTNTALELKAAGIKAYYRLYDFMAEKKKTEYADNLPFDPNLATSMQAAFTIPSASKDIKVQFKFCADYNGSAYILKSDTECSGKNVCSAVNTTCYRETVSTDAFAVRPKGFYHNMTNLVPLKAGVAQGGAEFTAYDHNNNATLDYNESELAAPPSFVVDVNISDSNKTCAQPSLTFDPRITFSNGYVTGAYTLNNIGDFNVTMHEIVGSEYALIDADDTLDPLQRLITPFTNQIKVIPDNFTVDGNLTNGSNGFTYLSNFDGNATMDQNVSALLNANITARTFGGVATSNYTSGCYAKDGSVSLAITPPAITPSGTLSKMLWYDDINNSVQGNFTLNTPYAPISYSALRFASNGTGNVRYRLNFDRNQTTVVNPFTMTVNEVNVTDSDSVDGNQTLASNNSAYYVYGRVIPRDIRVFGASTPFTANAWYEVYNTPIINGTSLSASRNDANWYTNTLHSDAVSSYDGDGSVTVVITGANPTNTTANGGVESYSFASMALGGYKAHINTDPWLWYGMNALGYLDPASATNLNCMTHPCFNINIVPPVGATGSAKSTNEATKGSKKSDSSGWRSTTDYAPAIR